MADWQSGLGSDDSLGTPMLTAGTGIDPDEVRLQRLAAAQAPGGARVGMTRYRNDDTQAPALSGAAAPGTGGEAPVLSTGAAPAAKEPAASPLSAAALQGLSDTSRTGHELESTAGSMAMDPTVTASQQQVMQDLQNTPNAADPKYKAGWGTRVLRGLRGAGIGLLTGGIPGALVGAIEPQDIAGGKGYKDPNDAYSAAYNASERKLGNDQRSLDMATSNWKDMFERQKSQGTLYKDAGERYGAVVTGATGQQNAETSAAEVPIKQQTANTEQQKVDQNSPQGKVALSQAEVQQRSQMADQFKLPPSTRSLYVLTGKIPDPRQATAEEVATGQALAVFRKQNGREPQTLDEFRQVREAATGRGGNDKGQDANLRAAAHIAAKHLQTLETNFAKMTSVGLLVGPEAAAAQKEIDDAKSELAGYQSQLTGGDAAPTQSSPAAPEIKQPVPDGYVRVTKDGHVQDIPASGLDAASKRGWTKYGARGQ